MNDKEAMNKEFEIDEKRMVKNITVKDMFDIFMRKILLILVIPLVLTGSLYAYDACTYTPKYASTATLYILRQASSTVTASEVASDFSLALKVVNDCTYMLKGHTVLDKVRNSLNLEMEHEDLYKSISTYNPESTRILEVTVKAESPRLARSIVDELCRVGVECINDTMGYEQVNLYEGGTYDMEPCNKIGIIKYIVLFGGLAAVIYILFLIVFLFDDTLKDDEEIQKYLGLSILGDIPNADAQAKKRYGRYQKSRYYANKYGEEE